jgi:RNA polymerase sigma-70 factor (ECF subfamily)
MVAVRAAPETSPTLLGRLRAFPADQDAWREFVSVYGIHLFRWARHWGLQASDAEDVTQATLLRLAKAMHTFDYNPEQSFRAWLRTLTHHAWQDLARVKKPVVLGGSDQRNPLLSLEAKDDLARAVEAAYDEELLRKAMASVRLRVEPQTWEAFRLSAIENLPGVDVAQKLGMRLTSVYKARSNVQKMLQEEIRLLEEEHHALNVSS